MKNPAQPAPQKRKEPRVNYKTLGAAEYMLFRRSNCYSKPRSADVPDNRFWVPEQAFVLSDVYRSYRHPIRVMNPLKLSVLKDKESFALAASIVERMQLDDLMEIRCPYNVDLVLQFMSTVYIFDDIAKTMTWMSGTTRVESTFDRFAQVLGYTYQDYPPIGHRMHDEKPSRDQLMSDMYYPGGIPGKLENLLPFYSLLVRIFRSFIAPSGGNNDALTSPLCNLLILAKQCVEDEDPTKAYPVDVMDFIFNELFNSLMGRYTIPYAPYIMLFIRRTLRTMDFGSLPVVDHHYKKLYIQKGKSGGDHGPTGAPERGSFMRDARTSSTAAPRTSSTAAPRAPSTESTLVPHIRKLSWFQRTILCMKVDVHREQYMSYRRDIKSSNAQQLILHHVSGSSAPPPTAAVPNSYAEWAEDDFTPWVQIGDALTATAPAGASYAQPDDDEDDESEDNPEASGQSEASAGESTEGDGDE